MLKNELAKESPLWLIDPFGGWERKCGGIFGTVLSGALLEGLRSGILHTLNDI